MSGIEQSCPPARRSEIVDALMDSYVSWRQESSAVAESYRSWQHARRAELPRAYAAYVEALDREEDAADAYRRLVEQVEA